MIFAVHSASGGPLLTECEGRQVLRPDKRMLDGQKQQWAQDHARRIQKRFEQWQQPLGIDGREYIEYLRVEFMNCCDDPLLREFIESISQDADSLGIKTLA